MSQENVEAFRRFVDAYNRRDLKAMLDEVDSELEWHPALLASVVGAATVYRGHEGVRKWVRDVDEAFVTLQAELPEIRDLGERIVAIGHILTRGKGSGAETDSPFSAVADYRNAKAIRVRTYLDPQAALEAAGLRE